MRFALAFLVLLTATTSAAQVPTKVAFQGRLMDASGAPMSGVPSMTFELFDDEVAGTSKWVETQAAVPLTDGYYAVTLGSVKPLELSAFDGTTRFIEVTVNGAKLSPRQRVASVPFALVAAGLANKNDYVLNQTATPQPASLHITGKAVAVAGLAAGTSTPTARLHAVGGAATAGSGLVWFDGTVLTTLRGDQNTRFSSEIAPGDLVTVTPDTGTSLTRRVVAVTSNHELTVDVAGSALGFVNRPYTIQKPVALLQASDGSSTGLTVNGAGHVGIATSTPRQLLDVAGPVGVNGNPVILWQEFPTPLVHEFSYSGQQTLRVSINGVPAGARYLLANVYANASVGDHHVFLLGRGVSPRQAWVITPGIRPSTQFGNLAQHAVALYFPGDNDQFSSAYGVWYSSQVIPLNADGSFDFASCGSNGTSTPTTGWLYLVVRAFSL